MSELSLSGRTVCIVDDDELVRNLISVQLSQHAINVLDAANSSELFGLMKSRHIDCILMDFDLASENGLFVQDQLRDRFTHVPPIIMLSAVDNQRTIIKAFRTGVSDYLLKRGLRIEELLQSLRSAIERRDEDDTFKGELERLKRQSVFDEVTGFYRREAIEDMLASLAKAPVKTRKAFAVLLIRVNQFDRVSAQAGQAAGQRVIRAFASRLRKSVRNVDVCGRFDASTFIYLVDTSATRQEMVAHVERLDTELRFSLDLETMSLGLSASFGMALYPAVAAEPISLILCAEGELDRASTAGGYAPGTSEAGETCIARTVDRRGGPRHRVFKGGKIIFNGGQSVVDCAVRDLSEGGARLRLAGTFTLPPSFDLLVVGSGTARPAQRVWQHGDEIGVAFTD